MKGQLPKDTFLSTQQQKIIWRMYNNGGTVSYKTQNVYRNERKFIIAMGILMEAGAVALIVNDEYYNEYVLTKEGKFLCKHGIIPIKRN